MFHGAEFGYKRANYLALENWVNVYDGDLGIALSDTYTTDVFLKNFSRKHAKLFDGVRHDSGDPYKFVNKVIDRYKELGINPTTKTIIFSNALDFDTYKDIALYCNNRINCAAGIGTNLTNDCGFKPSNIVMKLTKCRMNSNQPWYNCIKLSDDVGKHMGYDKEIEICKYECGI
jgi:nicotinate phosphoribosyltransferase